MSAAQVIPGPLIPGPPIPGPQGADMLRALPQIRHSTLDFLAHCQRQWGPVVAFPIPGAPVLLVTDPGATLRVLQTNHTAWGKDTVQYRTLGLVTGEGLLVSDGDTWRARRRMIQPAFTADALARLDDDVARAGRRLLASWQPRPAGGIVDIDDAMMTTTLEVVGRTLLGADLAGEARELSTAVLDALHVVVAKAASPMTWPGWRVSLTLRRPLQVLDRAVAALVAHRRANPRPADQPDLLDVLLASVEGGGLDERGLRDEVVTAIVAGHETVASALTWAWWLLAENPAARRALLAEARALTAWPTSADLPRLPYARAVLDEALRLYPPAWVLTRRARRADVLAGYDVPAGALVILSPYLVHRDPQVWPQPLRFDPERFAHGAPREGYLPFGAGPRLCIGRGMALTEGTLLLAGLAREVELLPSGEPPPRVDPLVTLRPHDGLRLRMRRPVRTDPVA